MTTNQLNLHPLLRQLRATTTAAAAKPPFHPLLLVAGVGAFLGAITIASLIDSIPLCSHAATLVGSFHMVRWIGGQLILIDPPAVAAVGALGWTPPLPTPPRGLAAPDPAGTGR